MCSISPYQSMDSAFIAGLCLAAGLFVTSGHSFQDNIYCCSVHRFNIYCWSQQVLVNLLTNSDNSPHVCWLLINLSTLSIYFFLCFGRFLKKFSKWFSFYCKMMEEYFFYWGHPVKKRRGVLVEYQFVTVFDSDASYHVFEGNYPFYYKKKNEQWFVYVAMKSYWREVIYKTIAPKHVQSIILNHSCLKFSREGISKAWQLF